MVLTFVSFRNPHQNSTGTVVADTGARPDEAVSLGKIREDASAVERGSEMSPYML